MLTYHLGLLSNPVIPDFFYLFEKQIDVVCFNDIVGTIWGHWNMIKPFLQSLYVIFAMQSYGKDIIQTKDLRKKVR